MLTFQKYDHQIFDRLYTKTKFKGTDKNYIKRETIMRIQYLTETVINVYVKYH